MHDEDLAGMADRYLQLQSIQGEKLYVIFSHTGDGDCED